ncbi:MAG TPA: hypothetical protein DGO43_03510 [Chloroflexi bacterium]|nr:hypothetical protein [Chloroflexota bacterium]
MYVWLYKPLFGWKHPEGIMAIYIDDRELVAAHQAGDGEAFDELVREHRRSLLSHAKNKLHCDAASEDALQETLVRAYKALPRFNGEYRLGPWLHRIMSNVCIDEANRRKRDGEKTDQYAAQRTFRDEMPSVEDELGLHIDDSALKAALDGLSEPYRQALELKFVQEYDYSEVAAAAGVSEENARARVSRARLVMRSALKGVAAIPVVLLGVLKRGEKAAAAATSATGAVAVSNSSTAVTTALPALADAGATATHLAPAVIPLVTKAAVGIGLAAAVLTPTTDSAVHQAVAEIRNGAAGIVLEDAGSGFDVVSLAEESSQADAVMVDPRAEVKQVLEQTPAKALSQDQIVAVDIAEVVYLPTGPNRYQLVGRLDIGGSSNLRFFDLSEDSSLVISDQPDEDGRYRVDALLVLGSTEGEFGELRLAGFVESRTNESRAAGLYRLSQQIPGVLPEGTFSGIVKVTTESSNGVFRLTLGS